MNKQGTIYKIENLVNGKVYIGQTAMKAKYRKTTHFNALEGNRHPNKHLQRAWNKYGRENFKFQIIEKVNINKLDDREIYWIRYYKNKAGVYNLDSGGNKNKKLSKESKEKMSLAVKQRLKNPYYLNILKENARKNRGANNCNAKRVICINTGEVFDTATEACNKYGIKLSQISKVITGERISCFSKKYQQYLQFAYYEEGGEYKLKENVNIQEPKKVICINTGEIFRSTWEAAKTYNISQGSLVLCCQGERHSCGKDKNGTPLLWEYLENYDENKTYRHIKNEGARNPRSHPVVCITTGEYFESQRQAELKYNIAQGKISMVCTGKRKHAGGLPDGTKLKWEYAD